MRVRHPKTAGLACQPHVKISDPDVIMFVDRVFGHVRLDEQLLELTLVQAEISGMLS